eukprot:CAMPEP_0170182002 /NCGR_PEP_ID=MMETSP0040_2-20121228/26654_1 /TAXON_ID=641309 /ORGANISM="Lotharella oceanica, Strain CCMP622" /LENGTH=268 /DNA_ID=CAMNT_0010427253 /DNA_START=46 /DNA_END=852 /DNA_ORIENTATION=-
MRRMAPSTIENSLAGLCELAPDLTDDLLNNVDQPLKIESDSKAEKKFICCDYNRDGDSFRSPWSNTYFPPADADALLPSKYLRGLEEDANAIFDVYRKLYFEGGSYSSVYFFSIEGCEDPTKGFGACFLVHKDVEAASGSLKKGWWDSTHVFQVNKARGDNYEYKLTSTVMISMVMEDNTLGSCDLSGSMNKQKSETKAVKEKGSTSHLINMGTMIENMDHRIRAEIMEIYFSKTRQIIDGMRLSSGARNRQMDKIAASLKDALKKST